MLAIIWSLTLLVTDVGKLWFFERLLIVGNDDESRPTKAFFSEESATRDVMIHTILVKRVSTVTCPESTKRQYFLKNYWLTGMYSQLRVLSQLTTAEHVWFNIRAQWKQCARYLRLVTNWGQGKFLRWSFLIMTKDKIVTNIGHTTCWVPSVGVLLLFFLCAALFLCDIWESMSLSKSSSSHLSLCTNTSYIECQTVTCIFRAVIRAENAWARINCAALHDCGYRYLFLCVYIHGL